MNAPTANLKSTFTRAKSEVLQYRSPNNIRENGTYCRLYNSLFIAYGED
jgi:hypothetical protein